MTQIVQMIIFTPGGSEESSFIQQNITQSAVFNKTKTTQFRSLTAWQNTVTSQAKSDGDRLLWVLTLG